jgi:hypothetical protein
VTRPACSKCTEKGRPCPGYTDIFDKAHRDETTKVVKRNVTGSRSTVYGFRMLPAGEVRSLPHAGLMVGTLQGHTQNNLTPTKSIPPSMPQDPKSDAVALLFRRYSSNTDADATCSFLSLLPAMYTKSSMSSPLTIATTALAIQVFGIYTAYGYSGDTALARVLYAKAVTRTREALRDPELSKSDDLLMTTLILEEYESRNDIFEATRQGRRPQHVCGSVALLKHRGQLNYRDQLSWRLFTATRSSLLHHPWPCGIPRPTIMTIRDICDRVRDAPQSLSARSEALIIEIDVLVGQLQSLGVKINSKYSTQNDNTKQSKPSDTRLNSEESEVADFQAIVSGGIDLMDQCSHWYAKTPRSWSPSTVPIASLHSSIIMAGVYEHVSPTTYANLDIANSINRHRVTEIGAVLLVHICLSTTSSRDEQSTSLQQCLLARVQVLIDEICASVPFFVGNVTEHTTNIDQVQFAHSNVPRGLVDVPTSTPSQLIEYPDDRKEHARQIVASGLHMLYGILTNVIKYIEDSAEARGGVPAVRTGQIEWIKGQVARLQASLQQRCFVAGC